jgi:2'-5' RNA ligase
MCGCGSGCQQGHPERVAKAIEMFLDERADATVRGLWRLLADSGLSSLETYGHARHRPHVSLTVTSDWDLDLSPGALDDIRRAVSARRSLVLDFQALGTFAGGGGVLFLAATPTLPLLVLHERIGEILRHHGIAQWPHYLPGTWVPHCTLAVELALTDVTSAVGQLCGFEPFQAQVVGIGVADTSTGTITALS